MGRRKRKVKWDVAIVAHASRYLGVVMAASEEEAQALGEALAADDEGANLCHQCASRMDLGDFDEVHVSPNPDEDGSDAL